MTQSRKFVHSIGGGGLLLAILGSLSVTGCQIEVGGQTLPSAYYLQDDIQYYAPGPEFKLAREAAALKEQQAELIGQSR